MAEQLTTKTKKIDDPNIATPNTATPDPEMLQNLEMLLLLDIFENEGDWETVENLDDSSKGPEDSTLKKSGEDNESS